MLCVYIYMHMYLHICVCVCITVRLYYKQEMGEGNGICNLATCHFDIGTIFFLMLEDSRRISRIKQNP